MTEQEGYIKIDRNIRGWGWYKDIKTCHLFLHLLLSANYKDSEFMGVTIKRGQLAASYATLAEKSGMTKDEVRTALSHLKKTGEAHAEKHPRFLVITISNYDLYQTLPTQVPRSSHAVPTVFPRKSQQEKEIYKGNKGKKERNIGRSAPDSFSETRSVDSPGTGKMPDRDVGTAEDIPEMYREQFKTYPAYWDWRNQ